MSGHLLGPALGVVRENKVDAQLIEIEWIVGQLRHVVARVGHRPLRLEAVVAARLAPVGPWTQSAGAVWRTKETAVDTATGARPVAAALVALELDRRFGKIVRYAVLLKEGFEPHIFFPHPISLASRFRKYFFQTQDFFFQGLDILLFAFAVRSTTISSVSETQSGMRLSPLRLTVELLSASQSRLTVRFGPSPLRCLSVCVIVRDRLCVAITSALTFRLLLIGAQLVEE